MVEEEELQAKDNRIQDLIAKNLAMEREKKRLAELLQEYVDKLNSANREIGQMNSRALGSEALNKVYLRIIENLSRK